MKTIDFLDVTLDLNSRTYKTFNKPNNTPLYVHKQSSHPPNVTKNIPLAVNQRISSNSSDSKLFEETKGPFQEALQKSGYDHKLKFEEPSTRTGGKRCRKRKLIYFNPPWSSGVKSNVGAQFLKLLDSCFLPNNPLYKIFNRHTVKISYRTTPNIQQIIVAHNRKILNSKKDKQEDACTCRANSCPVQGKCKQEGTIYQATVKHISPETRQEVIQTYVGLAATTFYKRHQNHKTTLKLRDHETKSELSKHIWQLKDKKISYDLSWKIMDRAMKFTPISKTCKLCTLERYYLICRKESYSLNKNIEFGDECLHKRFLRLSTVK